MTFTIRKKIKQQKETERHIEPIVDKKKSENLTSYLEYKTNFNNLTTKIFKKSKS